MSSLLRDSWGDEPPDRSLKCFSLDCENPKDMNKHMNSSVNPFKVGDKNQIRKKKRDKTRKDNKRSRDNFSKLTYQKNINI